MGKLSKIIFQGQNDQKKTEIRKANHSMDSRYKKKKEKDQNLSMDSKHRSNKIKLQSMTNSLVPKIEQRLEKKKSAIKRQNMIRSSKAKNYQISKKIFNKNNIKREKVIKKIDKTLDLGLVNFPSNIIRQWFLNLVNMLMDPL